LDTESDTPIRKLVILRRSLVFDDFQQSIAGIEDILGVAQHAVAGLGQFQPPPDPPEQVDAQRIGEFGQLAGNRLRRQGSCSAALAMLPLRATIQK
jgi:hypothetical protein